MVVFMCGYVLCVVVVVVVFALFVVCGRWCCAFAGLVCVVVAVGCVCVLFVVAVVVVFVGV